MREAATSERSGRPVGRLTPLSIPLRFGVVAGLTALLTMVAVGSRARVGRGPSAGSTAVQPGLDALELLAVVALLGGLVLLVAGFSGMRRLRRARDEPVWVVEPPPVPWYAKLLVLVMILALLVGMAGALLVVRHRFDGPPAAPSASTGPLSPRPPRAAPPADANPPGGEVPLAPVAVAALAVAVVAAAGAAALWARARGPAALPDLGREIDAGPVLEEALRRSVEDLRREPDPRRAIVAAYARMLAVLGRVGFPRRAAEAPLEFLRRVLGELEGDSASVLRLTDLFERAEFSRQPVTEAMRGEAIQALGAVRERLGAMA